MVDVKIVGIVNVTDDSFSDGGEYFDVKSAVQRCYELVSHGADFVDIGGVSTRPGSRTVEEGEEWRRIGPVIEAVSSDIKVFVDTYRPTIATRSIEYGAYGINCTFPYYYSDMLKTLAVLNRPTILMNCAYNRPHGFDKPVVENMPSNPRDFIPVLYERMKCLIADALETGLDSRNVIIDPGIGAFLSPNGDVSVEVLKNYYRLTDFKFPVMLACSRKGFLASDRETSPKDRDSISAFIAALVADMWQDDYPPLYLRVHNVLIHRDFLSWLGKFKKRK